MDQRCVVVFEVHGRKECQENEFIGAKLINFFIDFYLLIHFSVAVNVTIAKGLLNTLGIKQQVLDAFMICFLQKLTQL